MNKDIIKAYKDTLKEIKKNDEINANILYRDIWKDIILQYVIGKSTHKSFIFWLDYYKEYGNLSENAKRILISKLEKDGFKIGLRKECPTAYGISIDNVILYIDKLNNKQEKMPITTYAETRSR